MTDRYYIADPVATAREANRLYEENKNLKEENERLQRRIESWERTNKDQVKKINQMGSLISGLRQFIKTRERLLRELDEVSW